MFRTGWRSRGRIWGKNPGSAQAALRRSSHHRPPAYCRPPVRCHARAAPADDGFVAALRRPETEVVPEVARFEPGGVVLVDGRRPAADVVVSATGYRTLLEPVVRPRPAR